MTNSNYTYLVTGSAGFIGYKVAEKLLQAGHSVVGIDNLNDYYDPKLKTSRIELLKKYPNFSFTKGDIESQTTLTPLFNDHTFNAVYHLAARAGVRYSLDNPHVYFSTNSQGTLNILELMRQHNTPKILLASTSSLYAGQPLPFQESLPVNTPISPYAASKKSAEVLCYTYHQQFNIDVSILRYFTVYGPSSRPDMAILGFLLRMERDIPIPVYGDGSQGRDFTYVDDIAQGTILAEKQLGYEIINLGGGNNPIPLSYIIDSLQELLGKKAIIDRKPFHQADVPNTWADISKAQSLLEWSPTVKLDSGLTKTVDWFKENRSWLNTLTI